MAKSTIKDFFYICLIAGTFILGATTVVASISGEVSPENSMIMPLLGLAVPALLICNIIVALCWAFARKWWVLIPILAFVGSRNYLATVIQFNTSKAKDPQGHYLKLATYNVHDFGDEITGYSCKEIARIMLQDSVDILCFQEFSGNRNFPMDSIRKVLSHWPHALIPREDKKIEGLLPIAIFSRYPLKNERFITYPQSANCSMVCDVMMSEDTIRLINNHLQTTNVSQKRHKWERELSTDDTRREVEAMQDAAETLHQNFVKRASQANIITDIAKKSPHPVLLCGDLNTIPSSYTYHHLSKILDDGFKSAGKGYMYTYRYGKRLLRIDYIFHSPELKGISYDSPDLDLCSDHNPVVMEVKVK